MTKEPEVTKTRPALLVPFVLFLFPYPPPLGGDTMRSILVLIMVLKIPLEQRFPEQYSTNKLSESF